MTAKVVSARLMGALLTMFLITGVSAAQTPKVAPLRDKELSSLLENAKTPADHEKLAAFYESDAVDLEANAAKHKMLAATYRKMRGTGNSRTSTPPSMALHCDSIAAAMTKAAKEARTMADHHKMMAKAGPAR